MTKQIQEDIENMKNTSKSFPNSPILKINHELDSIVVNKGRVHEELTYLIQSNRTMKWDEILGILIDLDRELVGESIESKITEFESRFAEKSMSKV